MGGTCRPVSVNLRTENLGCLQDRFRSPGYFEIIADNWLADGPHHLKLDNIRQENQLLFHCVGMNLGGCDPLSTDYFKAVRAMAERWRPAHISDHLCIQAWKGCYAHDLLPFPLNPEAFDRVRQRVEKAQDLLGRTLVIENLSYYVTFVDSGMSEAEFLNRLAEKTGCGILLDINNIEINDRNRMYPKENFLTEIDLRYVKEIHVAGGELLGDLWVDTHGSKASPWVCATLRRLQQQLPDIPVIYEWDKNIPEFNTHLAMAGALNAN